MKPKRAMQERQSQERQKLIERQLEQRAALQVQFKELRKQQAEQLLELRSDVGRFLKLKRADSPSRSLEVPRGLRLER